MCILVTRDATRIYYKDWSRGQPVVFCHGWPLSADAWDPQLLFMGSHGYRVIAHDRRGHGRSEQTWTRNDMDGYADDLAALLDALDLREVILVGHSTGAGEAVRYLGRHGSERVAKLVLVATITPLLARGPGNPEGVAREQFEQTRARLARDRSELLRELAPRYYGAPRPQAAASQGLRDWFCRQGMLAGIKPLYDCVTALSETDFGEDLDRVDVPTLIIHGADDQLVPVELAARRTAERIAGATLLVYPGGAHGLAQVEVDRFNHDLLAFARVG